MSVHETTYARHQRARWLRPDADRWVRPDVARYRNVEWLNDYHDVVQAARDEPKALDELRAGVGLGRPGYDDHHIVEQTWAERFGFSRGEIDDPANLVSIPRLKHYQITGWYGARNPDYGWVSPREYLSDKSWDERVRVGQRALIRFEVLKP